MPNRVSVKTEDLVDILTSYVHGINQKNSAINQIWGDDYEVLSFTEFREMEGVLSDCLDSLTAALIALQNRRR
jgi:hypothetical protein